jgi:hypothetical protein
MKSFFCKFWCVLQSLGCARAASELARAGRYEEANFLIANQESCKC